MRRRYHSAGDGESRVSGALGIIDEFVYLVLLMGRDVKMANKNENNVSDSGAEDTATASNAPQKLSLGVKNDNQSDSEPETRDKGVAKIGAALIDPKIQAYIFAGLAVLGTAFLLFGVIGKNQLLDRLSHIEHAGGLVAFTLTVGTISTAILVTLGALMGRDGEARERIYRAKEILTILIGVLGTIVGFYFGSQDSEAVRGL
jgi:hypothetical protein